MLLIPKASINRAKSTKGIGREEGLFLGIVGKHYLWPVHHRSEDKL